MSNRYEDRELEVNDKPSFNPVEIDENEEYFGVETEIDFGLFPTITSKVIKKILPEFYTKRDGSLSPSGLEVNTLPAPYNWYMKNKKYISDVFSFVTLAGYRVDTGRPGIHVHISRTAFKNEIDIAKLLWIVEEYQDELRLFSGRKMRNMNWCKFHRTNKQFEYEPGIVERFYNETLEEIKGTDESRSGRYFALNLIPENTVEIRLFNSSIEINRWISIVQFVKTLIDFARSISIDELEKGKLDWLILCTFIRDREGYEELKEIMEERNLYYV